MAAVYPQPVPVHAFADLAQLVQPQRPQYVIQGAFPGMPAAMPGYQQQQCVYWGFGSAGPAAGQPQQLMTATPNSSSGVASWASGTGTSTTEVFAEEGPREEAALKGKKRGSRKSKRSGAAAVPTGTESWAVYIDSEAGTGSENDGVENCPFRAKWGEPIYLCEDDKACGEVMEFITACEPQEQHALVTWLLRVIKPLALSKQGTHVVQKLLEHCNKAEKERITDMLKPHILELYESPNGNHALAKVVEQLPSATVQFIVREYLGKARDVARHQYGCRIMERLIEHCPDEGDMSALLDEVVADAEPLCRHPFGNFVVQHLLEHGSIERREGILHQVDYKLPTLAMHRTASHFVQQLLDYSDQETQRTIVRKLLHSEGPEALQQVAGSRYGSFVIEQLANLTDSYDEAQEALRQVLPFFTPAQLKFARRVIDKFALHPSETQ